MMTACGLTMADATADAEVLQSAQCPSLACAESMTSLVDDCAGSIEHLSDCEDTVRSCNDLIDNCAERREACQHEMEAHAYYLALERSTRGLRRDRAD
eukprot:SAG22_NODE_8736_length_634_cov_0.727103_1_plen_97_part_01